MAIHRLYIDASLVPGLLAIAGEEAHHAVRVKRLGPGDGVEILDGRGAIARAEIRGTEKAPGGWTLMVEVGEVRVVPPLAPRLDVVCPVPKGPRVSDLIDGLSQAGAARWSPLQSAFSLGDARESRLDRTRRIAAESSKQCGRAWLLEVGPQRKFSQAICGEAGPVILADAAGDPYQPTRASMVTLVLGPEGGWRADELEQARALGARITRFGPHTMRIETAAVAAAAIILDHESRESDSPGPRSAASSARPDTF